jgi:hypothetical protein
MAGKSKYTFKDENFFEKIDSEEKAYFLGLIFADGSLNNKLKTLQLTLVEEDSDILEYFIRNIYLDRELRTIYPRSVNHKVQKQVTITSRIFYESLLVYHLSQNKSENGIWVNEGLISKELFHHFIRGYFDGDGCIYHNNKSGDKTVSFTGSHVFIENLRRFLVVELSLNKGNISKRYKDGFSSTLTFGGLKQVEKIKKYLYKDSNIYFKRKLLKFNQL